MLPRIEYSATVPVSVDEAFLAFQDLTRHVRSGLCTDVSWIEGKPWEVGSRLQYSLIQPRTTLSSVVIACNPPYSISLLHHALGITTEEHITITAQIGSRTRIRMTFEFVGESQELPSDSIRETISRIGKAAMDSLVESCQRRQSGSAGKK